MKIVCAFIFCIAYASPFRGHAQEVHDAKKDRAVLDGYLSILTSRSTGYFYGLYVDNYLSVLNTTDSLTIKKFLSTPNEWSGQRSIFISRIADLDQLNNLHDTVLVYGPRSMRPYVRGYVPPPQPQRVAYKKYSILRWFGNTFASSWGYSPSRFAYGRWYVPYTITSLASNPNALPFYMTQTNTNKYLLPSNK